MDFDFVIDTSDLGVLAKDLKAYNLRTKRNVNKTMNGYVDKLRDEVRRRASGRPGPRSITGRYANSIKARRGKGIDSYSILVWSDHPASLRLEYGFVGVDSLGRMYSQPPYPHFRPAIAHIEPRLRKALADQLEKAWFSSGL